MKKILLIISIVLCIFQMVVLGAEITIGSAAINRSGYYNPGNTYVDRGSTANGTGTITTAKFYVALEITGAKVATFFVVAGNNLTARDSEVVQIGGQDPGVIPVGLSTATVDLDVVTGDYIGLYWSGGGRLDVDVSGNGEWHKLGDQTGCTDTLFNSTANRTLSIYGEGTTEVEEEEVNVINMGTNF